MRLLFPVSQLLFFCCLFSGASFHALWAQDAIGGGLGFDLRQLPRPSKTRLVADRLIDCSTNVAYRREQFGDYMNTLGLAGSVPFNHATTRVSCKTCHVNMQPTVGVGDRPQTPFATFTLTNYTADAQKYKLYVGEEGEGQWQELQIGPREVKPHYWQYHNPRVRRTPAFWLYYNGKTTQVAALSTPNKNIGALYYIDFNGQTTELRQGNQPLRTGR